MATVTVAIAGTGDTTALSAYPSAAFTPAAGELLVVLGYVSGSVLPGAAGTCTASANSMTFTRAIASLDNASSGQLYTFVSNQFVPSSPASMTVSVNVTGDNGTGGSVAVIRVAGMGRNRFGANAIRQFLTRSNIGSGTTPGGTMDRAALTGNVVIGMIVNNLNPAALTPPTNFTEGGDTGYATPTSGIEWAYRASGHTSATVTWGAATSTVWDAQIFELDTSDLNTTFGIAMS